MERHPAIEEELKTRRMKRMKTLHKMTDVYAKRDEVIGKWRIVLLTAFLLKDQQI